MRFNRFTMLFYHRYEQIHYRGEPEKFLYTCIQSAAVGPECIAMLHDHHSGPNLRGSPRGQPQETDRPRAQHYVIMTSVLCWADRGDGWTEAVTGDHQPHESCVWAVRLWIILLSVHRVRHQQLTQSHTRPATHSIHRDGKDDVGNSCGRHSKIFQAKQCNLLWLASSKGKSATTLYVSELH